jgi:hypothetical protein
MRRADAGEFPQALWRALSRQANPAALVPESAGGAGLEMADALSLLLVAGRLRAAGAARRDHARRLAAVLGRHRHPEGPLAVAPVRDGDMPVARRDGTGWKIEGRASRVPWAKAGTRHRVLARIGPGGCVAALVAPADCRIAGRRQRRRRAARRCGFRRRALRGGSAYAAGCADAVRARAR